MSDKQVTDDPIFRQDIVQNNFNTIGGEMSVYTQLKNFSNKHQESATEEYQDDTQA